MVYANYDLSNFPAVYVYISGEQPTEEMFDKQMKDFEDLLNRDEPFYILYDIRNAKRTSIAMLKREAKFIKRMKPKIIQNLIASSIVAEDMFVRGLIKLLFSIQPPSRPNKTFDNAEDAVAFLEEEHRKYVPGTAEDVANCPEEEDTDGALDMLGITNYFQE